MDLELLQSISLAVSQVRTVDTVLKMIVSGLVEKAGFALARIWLIGRASRWTAAVGWGAVHASCCPCACSRPGLVGSTFPAWSRPTRLESCAFTASYSTCPTRPASLVTWLHCENPNG